MELAIDTSTAYGSICLSGEGRLVAELTWRAEQSHTRQLVPAIDWLMRQQGVTPSQIKALFVAKGPGSFTGLRIAFSTVKGLALVNGAPVAAVGTLDAYAYAHAACALPVCASIPVGRGEVAAATFRLHDGQWQQVTLEHLTTIERLAAETQERTLFCGDLTEAQRHLLRGCLGDKAALPPPAALLPRAGLLAERGWQELQAGHTEDPATLQPLYLRQPSITAPKKV